MEPNVMIALGSAGAYASLAVASVGSGVGTGVAGASAVGAWKKCYAQNKAAPFQLIVFAGAPLSQAIYGMIMMFLLNAKAHSSPELWVSILSIGILSGLGLAVSSWYQGVAAAGACDALAETGKGFTNYLMVVGIVETVSIFVMAFAIVLLATIGK